jgi:hypothetical protein
MQVRALGEWFLVSQDGAVRLWRIAVGFGFSAAGCFNIWPHFCETHPWQMRTHVLKYYATPITCGGLAVLHLPRKSASRRDSAARHPQTAGCLRVPAGKKYVDGGGDSSELLLAFVHMCSRSQ